MITNFEAKFLHLLGGQADQTFFEIENNMGVAFLLLLAFIHYLEILIPKIKRIIYALGNGGRPRRR